LGVVVGTGVGVGPAGDGAGGRRFEFRVSSFEFGAAGGDVVVVALPSGRAGGGNGFEVGVFVGAVVGFAVGGGRRTASRHGGIPTLGVVGFVRRDAFEVGVVVGGVFGLVVGVRGAEGVVAGVGVFGAGGVIVVVGAVAGVAGLVVAKVRRRCFEFRVSSFELR